MSKFMSKLNACDKRKLEGVKWCEPKPAPPKPMPKYTLDQLFTLGGTNEKATQDVRD